MTAVAIIVAAILAGAAVLAWQRTRQPLASPAERAVHEALQTAAAAAKPLRHGLDEQSAGAAAPYLRTLTGARALAIFGADGALLGWDGPRDDEATVAATAGAAVQSRRRVLVANLVVEPVTTDDDVLVAVLGVVTDIVPGPGMLGVITEVARYVADRIELAELDASRARLDRAEVRALRAQISPHFIYNALNTIASFVRTDPARARELILEFADFTRYSFRTAGEFTVLADELRNIDRYLELERARFGDALRVRIQVAPEVLSVVLPFLALQPLVENAVRHGLAGKTEGGTVSIVAADEGTDCVVSIEDDGVGMDPEMLRSGAIDAVSGSHVGLANVDDRLRAAFGDEYGVVVETAQGAGTKVIMRIPKYRAGVRAP